MSLVSIDPWQALGDPTRRRIFARVSRGAASATEIAREVPVSRPAVSQHLKVLLDAQLVDVRRDGRARLYRARADGLAQLKAEIEGYWRQSLESFKELAERSYTAEEETR
jgi:DNA-binding transcriptional ArsR family regulator